MKLRASLPSSAAAASLDITGRVQLPSDLACVSMNPLVAGDGHTVADGDDVGDADSCCDVRQDVSL